MSADEMNVKQVAEFCGITERCVRKAVTNNRISPISMETPYRFSSEEVERFQTTRLRKSPTVTSTADLHIDSEFQELIAPLSDSEFKQLSDNCRAEGIRDPIIVWNNTIIDGHNRFRIAQEHKLSFKVKEMSFGSRDDVKHWIIANQLGRRNVTTYERCRLALLLKDSVAAAANQRMLAGKADPAQISAEGISGETRDILAKLAGVSHDTLSKVETLEREADDELKAKLRSGKLSINKAWTQLNARRKKADVPSTTSSDTTNEQVSDHSLLTCILQGRRPCNVHFLDAEEDELEESTGTNAVNLPATSDIIDSLSAVGQQSSVSDTSLIPSERIISLLANLEVFLLERWRFLFSLFESKPVYSSSDDLAKQWSGDIVLSPELGLESDFKNKLVDNETSENVNYVLAIEPCGVGELGSFTDVSLLSFTYQDNGNHYQVVFFILRIFVSYFTCSKMAVFFLFWARSRCGGLVKPSRKRKP